MSTASTAPTLHRIAVFGSVAAPETPAERNRRLGSDTLVKLARTARQRRAPAAPPE